MPVGWLRRVYRPPGKSNSGEIRRGNCSSTPWKSSPRATIIHRSSEAGLSTLRFGHPVIFLQILASRIRVRYITGNRESNFGKLPEENGVQINQGSRRGILRAIDPFEQGFCGLCNPCLVLRSCLIFRGWLEFSQVTSGKLLPDKSSKDLGREEFFDRSILSRGLLNAMKFRFGSWLQLGDQLCFWNIEISVKWFGICGRAWVEFGKGF